MLGEPETDAPLRASSSQYGEEASGAASDHKAEHQTTQWPSQNDKEAGEGRGSSCKNSEERRFHGRGGISAQPEWRSGVSTPLQFCTVWIL